MFRKLPLSLFVLTLATAPVCAQGRPVFERDRPLTADQAALVRESIARERATIREIQLRTPVVETYIQDTRPDPRLYQVPVADYYMLSRVDFRKAFGDKTYALRTVKSENGFFKGSRQAVDKLTRLLGLGGMTYNAVGFSDMMFVDPSGYNQRNYAFNYVRREFLGSVRTCVFDVHPTIKGVGRFYGRIWIEDQGGNIVRFNGTYTSGAAGTRYKYFFHVDSWRENIEPGLWLPVAVYVEETHRTEDDRSPGLKAQTHFWGYSLKLPTRDSENVNIHVDDAVDQSNDSEDVGPLEASRMWVTQAENNVIDRLEQAGLVAPVTQGGYEQKVLDQIIINLAVPNNLAFPSPVHARVLLTDTLEATTVGNTILISKGLLDSLPSEEAIASVVAMELAHIALGHHIDTRYAFNDRLLFPDEATFQRIDMYHSAADNTAAAKTAMTYLENSMYKDKLANAGLYYEQLVSSAKVLKALNTPTLGDSLLKPDGTPWMAALENGAPKLEPDNPAQIAALPMGSWLKTDPSLDTVSMLDARRYAPMNASEKQPFEVTPVFYRLQRFGSAPFNNASVPVATAPTSASNQGDQPQPPAADQGAPGANVPDANAAAPAAAAPSSSNQGDQPQPPTPGASAPDTGQASPPPAPGVNAPADSAPPADPGQPAPNRPQ